MIKILLALLLLSNTAYAAVSFDGSNDILSCGTANTLLTENGAATIYAYVNATDVGETAGRILDKGSGTGTNGVILSVRATQTVGFSVVGTTSLNRFASNNAITYGTNQSIITTWDGSLTAANSHIYIDGVEPTYATTQDMVTPTDNGASVIHIGNDSTGARTFNGIIHEVAVWDVELTAQEIAILAKSNLKRMPLQIRPANLKAYWILNECADVAACTDASMFRDISGNVNTCSPSNSPTGAADSVFSYP